MAGGHARQKYMLKNLEISSIVNSQLEDATNIYILKINIHEQKVRILENLNKRFINAKIGTIFNRTYIYIYIY